MPPWKRKPRSALTALRLGLKRALPPLIRRCPPPGCEGCCCRLRLWRR
jgi:hypothetical protein